MKRVKVSKALKVIYEKFYSEEAALIKKLIHRASHFGQLWTLA